MGAIKEKMKTSTQDEKMESQFTDALFESVRRGLDNETNSLLDLIYEENRKQLLLKCMLPEEETILHTAVKTRASRQIIVRLIDFCPDLLLQSRETSDYYRGQTALHIAITQGSVDLIDELLVKAESWLGAGKKRLLLEQRATGMRFSNSVMMGEYPLTVAALTLNIDTMSILLKHGADINKQNSFGDNLCHSLVKYSHLYPEKVSEIMNIFEHVSKLTVAGATAKMNVKDIESLNHTDLEKQNFQIWLKDNTERLSPLKLAASLGQYHIFKYIIELKGVYCYINSEDGLFDVKLYDVTEIDTVSELRFNDLIPFDIDAFNAVSGKQRCSVWSPKSVPTLEMIFNSDASTVFKFIEFSPLFYVINRKWEFYKWFYLLWGVLHVLFMVGYSVYAVERSKFASNTFNGSVAGNYVNQIGENTFITFYIVLSLIVAVLYFAQELIRTFKHRMPWTLPHVMNCYHNGPFRLVLVLFSISVITDFIWRMLDVNYENYLLVCSMILGWWFLVFFLRGIRQFSFFTVMIQKVLIGDMFRFSIVIGMELIAFTTGMYIVFQGAVTSNDSVESYGKLTVQMFQMMFGFTNLDVLFEARQAWFAVCLYTAFVLLTYVLMINSLIAMMSNTCSIVSQNRDVQWRVQQLSIVLFLESVLPSCCMRYVGQPRECDWFDADKQEFVRKQRYFMEVRSLLEVTRSKSRHRLSPETMIETIFNTVQDIKLPNIAAVFESDNKDVQKRDDAVIETVKEDVGTILSANYDNRKLEPRQFKDEEIEVDSTKEKKKRKKKKRVTVEPESKDDTLQATYLAEDDCKYSTLTQPDSDIFMKRNVLPVSLKNSNIEIHDISHV